MTQDLDFCQGHRERLRQKFLDNKLTDYELVEMILSFAIPRRDVRPLARGLIKYFGGIHQIFAAPIELLIEYPGIGRNTAIFIKAIHQIMLSGYKSCLDEQPIFHNKSILENYCRMQMMGKEIEEFHVLYMDTAWRLLADDLHTVGTTNYAEIYPREILKRALMLNARHIVLLHNHPTPNTSFSSDDIKTTTNLQEILAVAGIDLHDHMVVSGGIVYSARFLQLLK